MFRAHDQHLQVGLFDTLQQLPEKVRQRLESSWGSTFYREVFCRIDESPFAVLYSDEPSRPNIPINILVAADILKAGHGWSDEQLYDEIQFNLQVRYALGLWDISVVPFTLRSLYHFRQRLSRHMQEMGENLLDQVFAQVTDEQLQSLKLKTEHQRMDSVLVSSNIRQFSRLHLLVEIAQRVWRMLTAQDQAYYAELFEPYRQGTAGQYCYRLKGEEVAEHLATVGNMMHRLVSELEACYAEQPTYHMLRRVFHEHFVCMAGKTGESDSAPVRVKENDELSTGCLQSPDDWEATYRIKRDQEYRGYVANLTETCNPENELQLITKVQVAPNLTDDEDLGVEAVPDLKARLNLAALWTDGGYPGPDAEVIFRQYQVEHIPTNLRGCHPAPDRLGLAAFSWEIDEAGTPRTVCCPGRQEVSVRAGFAAGRFLCDFDRVLCETCRWADRCPAEPVKLRPARVLRVEHRQVQVARLRQRAAQARKPGNNWRAAIESTVRSVIHPFGGHAGKLPVRGQVRVTQMIIGSALMVNLRRIWRHEQQLTKDASKQALSLLLRGYWCLSSWFHKQLGRCFPNFTLRPEKA